MAAAARTGRKPHLAPTDEAKNGGGSRNKFSAIGAGEIESPWAEVNHHLMRGNQEPARWDTMAMV